MSLYETAEHIKQLRKNTDLIDKDLKDGKLVVVQFSDKLYSDKILADLNIPYLEYDDNFSE